MSEFNIYAVKDKLLDYFQQPFIAVNDNAVKAALADLVNNQEATHAIAQAPKHFELYKLGSVEEDGQIIASREFICECAALIRRDIREDASASGEVSQAVARSTAPNARGNGHISENRVGLRTPAAEGGPAEKTHPALRG